MTAMQTEPPPLPREEKDLTSPQSIEFATPRFEARNPARGQPERGDRRWWLAVIILAATGADLVLLATAKYGVGLAPDSVAYYDVARNLVSGQGPVSHTGEPLVWWPPLYPMLLALVGSVTRLDPSAFAHLVNAALFALVIVLSARLIRSGSRQSVVYAILGTCAVLFSRPLADVYAMALSECLFIPLVLLYIEFAQRYWNNHDARSLAVMILATALACLTRYLGITLVLAGAVTVMLTSKVKAKTRLTRLLAFAVLSLLPLGLWALRNYRLAGTFAGNRVPSNFTFLRNVGRIAETVVSWYNLTSTPMLVVLAWTAVLVVAVLSSRTARERLAGGLRVVTADHLPALLLLASCVITLAVAATRDAAVNSRMLSPIYIPSTIVLLKVVAHLFGPTQTTPDAPASKIPAVLLALWLCLSFEGVATATADRFRNGAGGYNTKDCRESETIACARQILSAQSGVRVYSNGRDVLWELAGVDAADVPRRTELSLVDLEGRWPAEDGSILVWFRKISWRRYLFSVEELQAIAGLTEIARLRDGSVYWVSARQITRPDSFP